VLKEFPPVAPTLSLRDDLLVWVVAIAFGLIGGLVAGIFFVGYHLRAGVAAVFRSTGAGKGTRG
jgi:hypothetical protein